MKITNMRVNYVKEPLGYCLSPISLSWITEDVGNEKTQAWARVIIRERENTIYDSGKCTDALSLDFPVEISLKPRTRYDWSVVVSSDSGETAEGKSFFETGKMNEIWKARWITPDLSYLTGEEPLPGQAYILKKIFDVKNIEDARLYICGLGVYECYINGEKVGNEFLAPGYHSYDLHLQTYTYDVSSYLKEGENKIEIWLGEGWFKGRLGFAELSNVYGDKLYAVGELYVGGDLILRTDESWSFRKSDIIFSGIYDGEIIDETLSSEECFPVCEDVPSGCGMLCDRYSLPIVKKKSFCPEQVICTSKGETILDFGQNLAGWVEFDCELPRGTAVRLTAGEILQEGCFYRENYRTAKAEFVYISAGSRTHARPHFTFYGFRYMLAEICSEGEEWHPLPIEGIKEYDFTAWHLRSDFDETGQIQTGNEKVNRLFLNAMWGQKDNFLDVPTDCPQRDERLGWTGDAQVFSDTACYNMYVPGFYRKYLWDMRAEQSLTDGAVPNVVPRIKEGIISECGNRPWADAAVIIPWNVYRHYGNRTFLKECYPGMKSWVEFSRREEEAEGGHHLVKSGFHFADWLALDSNQLIPTGATDPLFIASAYYYKGARILAESAEILGFKEDAEEYGRLAEKIFLAIKEKYFDDEGICICHTQTGSALAIMFGLSPKKLFEEGDLLSERVTGNGNHLNTGFVGTPFLCPALTVTGHHIQATDLLLNEEYPGWLYAVNLGATTIWERWNSVLEDGSMSPEGMNSLNHYSYGSIAGWMYEYLAGIKPDTPGFKKAVIEPKPDARLGYLDCRLDTAAGTYKSGWKYDENGKVVYEFTVPFDASALIKLPDGRKYSVPAGNYLY